ncbi:MAG: hypothetical protein KDB07_04670 [Planctomycetes bacterium]|nr:hypothetical protein [Planctomycetota bacterium]
MKTLQLLLVFGFAFAVSCTIPPIGWGFENITTAEHVDEPHPVDVEVDLAKDQVFMLRIDGID